MSTTGQDRPDGVQRQTGMNWKIISIGLVATGLAVVIGANAHLVYVAFASQPECMAHAKAGGGSDTTFAAAQSAC